MGSNSKSRGQDDYDWIYISIDPESLDEGYEINSEIRFVGSRHKEFEFKFGEIKLEFGFKRCELCFDIEDGKMPMKQRWPPSNSDPSIKVTEERQHTKGKNSPFLEARYEGAKPGLKAGTGRLNEETSYTQTLETKLQKVKAIGSDCSPKWRFESVRDQCLQEAFSPTLGILRTDGQNSNFEYWFEFDKNDVYVINLEWKIINVDLSDRKEGIARKIIKEKARKIIFDNFGSRLPQGSISLN